MVFWLRTLRFESSSLLGPYTALSGKISEFWEHVFFFSFFSSKRPVCLSKKMRAIGSKKIVRSFYRSKCSDIQAGLNLHQRRRKNMKSRTAFQ